VTLEIEFRYEEDLEEYEPFFDREWYGSQLEPLVMGTKLHPPVLSLGIRWRGCALYQGLPKHLIRVATVAVEGAIKNIESMIDVESLVVQVAAKADLPEQWLKAVRSEARKLRPDLNRDIPVNLNERLWRHLLRDVDLKMALLHAHSVTYGSVYFAYEAYLIHIMKEVSGLQQLKSDELESVISDHISERVAKKCWAHRDITLAKDVRHAIVHNGLKLTNRLKRRQTKKVLQDQDMVHGNELSLLPKHTLDLYTKLKVCAVEFTKEAVKKI